MRRAILACVLVLLAGLAEAQIGYSPGGGLPREITSCSGFLTFFNPSCDELPAISSTQRTLDLVSWSSGFSESAANLHQFKLEPTSSAIASPSRNFVSIMGEVPDGMAAPVSGNIFLSGNISYLASHETTRATELLAIEGYVSGVSDNAGHILKGGHFTVFSGQANITRALMASTLVQAAKTVGTLEGFRADIIAYAGSSVTSYGAAIVAIGTTAATWDQSKTYKIKADTGYGRVLFDQPDDAGTYAAEVRGAKGLLVGGAVGQLQLADDSTKPTCEAATRGSFWYEAGGAGVADTVEVCRKDAANAYAWVSVI